MNSKARLNSIKIGSKWQIKKSLFRNGNKFFVKASDTSAQQSDFTILLVFLTLQSIEESLQKIISQFNSMKTQSTHLKLLVPSKLKIQNILTNKMFVMPISERPINVDWLLQEKSYQFSPLEIIDSAISGITSLSELHTQGIVHANISTSTCYFYNRDQRLMPKSDQKTEILTYFAVCAIDAECFSVKGLNSKNKVTDLMYEPCSVSLGLKPTFKDDIECLIYVLIKMATKNQIFSIQRYEQEWKSEQQIRKWKINQLYLQILKHIPEKLIILAEFYLHLQQTILAQKIDYSYFLKRLWKQKENITSNVQKTKNLIEIKIQEEITSEINLNFENSQIFDKKQEQSDSEGEIFQEEIRIGIRTESIRTGKLNFYNDF